MKKNIGILSAISAYVLWGTLGIFWELLSVVPSMDTLAYRIIFSLVAIGIVLTYQKSWHTLLHTLLTLIKNRKIYFIVLSSFLISINWFIYIYMVTHHQATAASLGYYIMPIMNVAIAVVVLHEKLLRFHVLALFLVILGVCIITVQTGYLPFNTLLMAISFCFYGLIKRKVPLPAIISLALETICVAPISLIYLFLSPYKFNQDGSSIMILLIISGVVTIIPLLFFTVATKKTDFITLGFIQYLNPTIQLIVAIFVLQEPFNLHTAVTFVFIWAGILVFIIGSIRYKRHSKQ